MSRLVGIYNKAGKRIGHLWVNTEGEVGDVYLTAPWMCW